jgi:hypothetical protein
VFDSQWTAYSSAYSNFEFEFSLDSEHTWQLDGVAEAYGGGVAEIIIYDEFGFPVWNDFWEGDGTLLLNSSGTLPAGTYTLTAASSMEILGLFFPDFAAGEAGLDFLFTVEGSSSMAAVEQFAADRYLKAGPNPLSDRTNISFAGAPQRPVQLDVFDVRGRLVKSLVNNGSSSGQVAWDSRDASGRRVPQGTYFLRMRSGGEVHQRKVLVVR